MARATHLDNLELAGLIRLNIDRAEELEDDVKNDHDTPSPFERLLGEALARLLEGSAS